MAAVGAPRSSFTAGPARVDVDDHGSLTAVRHGGDPPVLTSLTVGEARIDGRDQGCSPVAVTLEPDEVTTTYAAADLTLHVRHSFGAGWTTRLALANLGQRRCSVDGLRLEVVCGAESLLWSVAAGTNATWVIVPTDPGCSLLLGRATAGAVSRIGVRGVELAGILLAPGDRHVWRIEWEWYPSTDAIAAHLPGDSPWVSTAPVGHPIPLADADTAVVAPPGVAVEPSLSGVLAVAAQPGDHRVELRSARGSTVLDLAWVPPLPEFLRSRAMSVLTEPRTPAGVVRLTDVAAALVVQHAVGAAGFPETDDGAEALDLFTARRPAQPALEPLWSIYLLGEFARQADPDLLTEAVHVLAAQPAIQPGLGLALIRAAVALLSEESPVTPVLSAVRVLLQRRRSADPPMARTELALATRRLSGGVVDAGLLGAASSIARRLGVGLPGRVAGGASPAEWAHLVAVLGLLTEQDSAELTSRWQVSPGDVADRAVREVLAQLADAPVSSAHAWLTLTG